MRIAIDYRSALGSPAGIGRFTRELVDSLAALEASDGESDAQYVLYAAILRGYRERSRQLPPSSPALVPCVRRFPGKLLEFASRFLPVSAETFTGPVDLFHLPDYAHPPVRSARVLATVHDVSFDIEPGWYPAADAVRLRRAVERRIAAGDTLLTVSENSRREILEHYAIDQGRVHVVPLGVDTEQFSPRPAAEIESMCARLGITTPYLLFVGTIQPRKNLGRLLEAVSIARSRGMDETLVIAGAPGWCCQAEMRAIETLMREGAVHHLGYVDDSDLPALYSGARGLCYPSHHEGFGLPVLEAMACGTAVLTSRARALIEVGSDAALQVDADSAEALADGVGRLTGDETLRLRLAREGSARAAQFTWERCARGVRSVYREMLA